MPSYIYRCERCGHKEEQRHAAGKRLSITCPVCESSKMTWQFPTPNLHTDTTFLANRDDGFAGDNVSRQAALRKARAAGVSTAGKVYCGGLCPPGERLSPKAWIDGKDDVRRICRENNWSSEDLGVRSADMGEEPKPPRLADDIVANEVARIAEDRGGDLTAKERKNLSHDVRERLTPKGVV